MRVGEEKRTWENGKALILDTSFEHETRNDSRRDRIVLIIDYWHPGVVISSAPLPCVLAHNRSSRRARAQLLMFWPNDGNFRKTKLHEN